MAGRAPRTKVEIVRDFMELWLTFVRTNRRLGVFDVDAAEGRIALWGVPIEMRPDAPPEAVPEDLAKLEQCAHFLARLAVGGGEPADWARLRRMYVALESDGSQRVKALEAIERTQATVAAGGDLGAEAKLLTLALAMVHPAFERLDVALVERTLADPGRMGPSAIAATFSIACGAWSDRGELKPVADRYDHARRALTK